MKIMYFHGYPCNRELFEWLVVYEAMAKHLGFIKNQLDVTQLIGGAKASGGTHSKGWAFDIWNASLEMVWLARQMGCPATWRRTPAQGFVLHVHGVMDPAPAGNPANYQTVAVKAGGPGKGRGYNGLGKNGMGGRDDGPRPLSGRTWRQGIEWALAQMEDDMANADDIREVLFEGGDGTPKELTVYQRVKRLEEAFNVLSGITFVGTPGTPKDQTLYQRLLRVEQNQDEIKSLLKQLVEKETR